VAATASTAIGARTVAEGNFIVTSDNGKKLFFFDCFAMVRMQAENEKE
jgi:hypothetical protein